LDSEQSPRIAEKAIKLLQDENEDSAFLPDLCSLQSVFVLVVGAQLISIALVLVGSSLNSFNWPMLGQLSMLMQWITLISAGLLCQIRIWLGKIPVMLAGALSYTLVVTVALAFTALGQRLLYSEIDLDILSRSGVITAIISGVVLRYMYLQQQLYHQQQASAKAQIAALQARIRPHFLFNSMNSIVSLITIDPERAERVTLDLCDLFRASLAKPALVPLKTELELIEQYFSIEKLRLGGRLVVHWQKSGDLSDVLIPSMIFQPLLENAIYHGIEPREHGGEIKISVSLEGEFVHISIINPIPKDAYGQSIEPLRRGNGLAQDNIRARLSAYCGASATFETKVNDGQYRVNLSYSQTKLQRNFLEPDLLASEEKR
jgi:two-component system sensor histidine kinase AlgZ